MPIVHRMIRVMPVKKKSIRPSDPTLAVLGGETVVTLDGKASVLIEKHNGILSYEEDRVIIACKGSILCVRGTSLSIAFMSRDRLCLCGCIQSVQWE